MNVAWSSEPAVVDLADRLGIESVGDFIKTNGRVFLCVQSAEHRELLWNPDDTTSLRGASNGCRVPPGGRFTNALVDYPPEEGVTAIPRETGFAGAQSITLATTGTTKCGPILPLYYRVALPGRAASFYLIVRLKKAVTLSLPQQCREEVGDGHTYAFEFAEVATLSSLDLHDGKTLLYGWHADAAKPALLLVHLLPSTVWSSQARDVFLIPQEILGPLLQAAGPNPGKRYRALLNVIGER